jgi:hypothetical protein
VLQEGLHIEIAKLLALKFQIKYHIKSKLGIGEQYHSHNNPQPVYEVGQGSTDASAW